jgi:hypothetical protein
VVLGENGELMNTLDYIVDKYHIILGRHFPIEIPHMKRNDLAVLFNELEFKTGVEIGVEQGLYSETLCKAISNLALYCIDPWKAYDGYHDYRACDQEIMEARHQEAIQRLSKYNCKVIQKFSMDAVNDFADESLDFVFIDGNHELPYVMDDICSWNNKVRIGGIVAGHDYYKSTRGRHSKCHVWYAVNCYTQALDIRPWFLVGMKGEAVGALPPTYNRDRERSFFWVRD